jgi:hypothetical protein
LSRFRSLLVVCLIATSASDVTAQQARGISGVVSTVDSTSLYGNSWSVIIGINQYDKWPALQYAVNDARSIRSKLAELGFPPENTIYLTDAEATRQKIVQVLGDELPRRVQKNDRVFIFFAGHGETEPLPGDRQEGYIVPVDGDLSNLLSTCISMTTVRQFSERMAAKHVFYAIDACYSGLALTRSGISSTEGRQYLQRVSSFRARQIVTAGRSGEQVIERGGHGLFTETLLLALEGNADKLQPFGVVTGSELGLYLNSEVALESGNAQTPQFGRLSSGEGEFLFVLPSYEPGTPIPSQESAPGELALGHLKINVSANGSRVYVNGVLRGVSSPDKPLEIQNLEEGSIRLRIEADGHEPVSQTTDIQAGQWSQLLVELPATDPTVGKLNTDVATWEEIVMVEDFAIHKYEVTNTQYAAFLNAKGNQRRGGRPWIRLDGMTGIETDGDRFIVKEAYERHPVIQVSWHGANAYCQWVGKRLPTDDEWKLACEGEEDRVFPWGNTYQAGRANIVGRKDQYPITSPIGHFKRGASPFGAMDMSGNVWEWTATKTARNQMFVRGGSWNAEQGSAKCSSRIDLDPSNQGGDLGFRCAR